MKKRFVTHPEPPLRLCFHSQVGRGTRTLVSEPRNTPSGSPSWRPEPLFNTFIKFTKGFLCVCVAVHSRSLHVIKINITSSLLQAGSWCGGSQESPRAGFNSQEIAGSILTLGWTSKARNVVFLLLVFAWLSLWRAVVGTLLRKVIIRLNRVPLFSQQIRGRNLVQFCGYVAQCTHECSGFKWIAYCAPFLRSDVLTGPCSSHFRTVHDIGELSLICKPPSRRHPYVRESSTAQGVFDANVHTGSTASAPQRETAKVACRRCSHPKVSQMKM